MSFDYIADATIDFSGYDYVIDDEPLLDRINRALGKEYSINSNVASHMDFSTALVSQPGTIDRLAGKTKPDLIHGLTALYMCGHCGGYDGTLIGVHVNVYERCVIWSNIGYSSDIIETYPKHEAFSHLPSYAFTRENYDNFLKNMRPYEIN